MNLTSDHPFWGLANGLLMVCPALDRDVRCEVIVVGGGITGALVSYHLVEAGIRTVLVDKRDIGTGSTSGSTGLLQYEVDVPLQQLIAQIGPAKANRSYKLCQEAIDKLGRLVAKNRIDCDFEKRPSLFLARYQKEIPLLQREFKLRRKIGIPMQLWRQTDIERHYGFSRPAALFSADGGQVDPHRLTGGLLTAAQRKGLQIFDRTKIDRFTPNRLGIQLTTDKGFKIKAQRAVIAAGYESENVLGHKAGRLKSTYALISEPLPHYRGWYQRSLIWETGQPYLYLRMTPDHRVIVGGEDEDLVNPDQRDALLSAKQRTLLSKFKRLFPEVALEPAYAWAGTFGETKDGLPYIGVHPQLPHAYCALGYGGNGITYSLIAAEIIRDSILGRKNADAKMFRFER